MPTITGGGGVHGPGGVLPGQEPVKNDHSDDPLVLLGDMPFPGAKGSSSSGASGVAVGAGGGVHGGAHAHRANDPPIPHSSYSGYVTQSSFITSGSISSVSGGTVSSGGSSGGVGAGNNLSEWLNGGALGNVANSGIIGEVMMVMQKDSNEQQLAAKVEARADNAAKLAQAVVACSDSKKELTDERSDIESKFTVDMVMAGIQMGVSVASACCSAIAVGDGPGQAADAMGKLAGSLGSVASAISAIGKAIDEGIDASSSSWQDKAVVAQDQVNKQAVENVSDTANQELSQANDYKKDMSQAVAQFVQTLAQIRNQSSQKM